MIINYDYKTFVTYLTYPYLGALNMIIRYAASGSRPRDYNYILSEAIFQ
jgi:hypothetical protein